MFVIMQNIMKCPVYALLFWNSKFPFLLVTRATGSFAEPVEQTPQTQISRDYDIFKYYPSNRDWDSSEVIATRYGLDGPGIPVGGRNFRTRPDRHWDSPNPIYSWYLVFTAGKVAGAWR
jgi:hypothetical protein